MGDRFYASDGIVKAIAQPDFALARVGIDWFDDGLGFSTLSNLQCRFEFEAWC